MSNTISDKEWQKLQDAARKAAPDMFSRKAVAERHKDAERRKNAPKN